MSRLNLIFTETFINLSTVSDLTFVDTELFPQDSRDYIQAHQDELELNDIYTEYLPYLGLRQNKRYSVPFPSPIATILSLSIDQIESGPSSLEI